MKKLIKNLGSVQIYEEEKDDRVVITATNRFNTEILTAYCLNSHTSNENRRNFFRNVAINYYHEIKDRFDIQ
jgi:hypothetical protein